MTRHPSTHRASTDSLGQITDYSWDFGDGSQPVDAGTNPVTTHTFARGTYTVTLTITTSLGQQVTATHDLTVDVAPTSSFTAPTGNQATHTPLTFDGSASTAAAGGEIVDYTWRFNDGTGPVDTGTSSVANHQYVAPGVYTVRLTVTDDLGLTGTITQTVTVDHPTAAFAVPPTPAPGASATFDASGSQDLEGTIIDYSWDFGDGTQPVDAGTDATTTHTFTARGPYTVTLTITNDSNQTDQITHTVTVDNPPTAAFSPSATLATPGSSLTFDGTASAPGDGSMITDYSWNFGDGSQPDDTGATATDSHLYPLPGVYTVRLTVTDDLQRHEQRYAGRHDRPAVRRLHGAADDHCAELTGELRRDRLERSRRHDRRLQLGLRRRPDASMPAQARPRRIPTPLEASIT